MSIDGLLEAAFVTWGNVASLLALLVTVISGYLVVAYVAAAHMTRSQIILINSIYLLMTGFIGLACVEMSRRAAFFEQTAYNMANGAFGELVSRGDIAGGIIAAMGLCMLGSLKFMWDIRRPKAD